MEDPDKGERMEKLCLAKKGNEQREGRAIRGRSPGSFPPVERIGEGIEKKIIPLVPQKITFSFQPECPE